MRTFELLIPRQIWSRAEYLGVCSDGVKPSFFDGRFEDFIVVSAVRLGKWLHDKTRIAGIDLNRRTGLLQVLRFLVPSKSAVGL